MQMEQRVDRVRRNNPVNEHAREVEEVLNGMHGKPGQRPDVDVVMVQVVYPTIQGSPVDQAMDQIEMHVADHGDHAHQRHAIDGVLRPTDVGEQMVGVPPQSRDFVCGPDRHGADEGPKQIVERLVPEEEDRVVPREPLVGVFEIRALRLLNVKADMPGAVDESDQRIVSRQDIRDPAHLKRLHVVHGGRKPKPGHDREGHVDDAPWQEIAGIAEEPIEDGNRLGRPGE